MTVQVAGDGVPPSFLAGYRPSEVAYDELYDPGGGLRPHWTYLLRSLESLGAEEFARRRSEGRRLLRERGVTYNVYDDPQLPERPWPLDPLPVLVPSAEWREIEQGLVQRAELLDAVLADLYGPRRLIRQGLLPPELVYGHGGFLLPCAGAPVAGGRHLPLYAADVARARDGAFVVLGDRAQAPSGSGYALENRVVMSHMLPSIFRDSHVHRLPLFFRRLRAMLVGLSPRRDEPPHVVLLTPGTGNETYFEHAYLADVLGCTLAQGDDLTVRDQRVWLRTLEGLRPVDVILRRVDGVFCDPLELRGDSLLGTPGLLQATRRGAVAIVNPLGASAVENPGLMAFLPALSRYLLGEELKLPSVRTWWCGEDGARAYVLDHLSEIVVKPIDAHPSRATMFGATLGAEERSRIAAAIRARPHLYVGQEHVALSTAPVIADGGRMEPRAMVLRTFVVADGNGHQVMPGGLCRVAADAGGSVVSNQLGGVSKDIWVLASEPERDSGLLLPADRPPSVVRGGLEVAGRVADNLFWVGRYAARIEAAARVLRETLRHWLEPGAPHEDPRLRVLLGVVTHVTGTFPGFSAGGAGADPERELLSVLSDADRPGTMRFNVQALLRAARAVQDHLSNDTWRVLNSFALPTAPTAVLRDAPVELERILLRLAAFGGLVADSMNRGSGWRFLEIGRRLEWALAVVATLRAFLVADDEAPSAPWEELLAIADASMTHRRRYRSSPHAGAVLDLLVDDESSPRSVLYQLLRLEALVHGLSSETIAPQRSAEEQILQEILADVRRSGAAEARSPRRLDADLAALLERVRARIRALSDQLTRTYFRRPDRLQQLVPVRR